MSIVSVIEDFEIECSNAEQLGKALGARLQTLKQANDVLLSQARVFVSQLEEHGSTIEKAIGATEVETAAHIDAMRAIIGGGE